MPGAWEVPPSVMCFTLHVDVTTFYWACGIRRLIIPGPFQDIIGLAGMPFDHARNEACKVAVSNGADYLFFLDSDVVPPRDAILRLLRHNLPLVSGLYCRRSPPHAIPVMQKNGQWVTNYKPGELVEVDLVGAGCMLIRRDVLERLPPQRPEAGKHWFDWRVDTRDLPDPKLPPLSEDFTFTVAVKRHLGISTFVDTSIKCLHIGYAEATHGQFVPVGATQGV